MKNLVFLFTLLFFIGCSAETEGTFDNQIITGQTNCDENISFIETKKLIYDYNLTYESNESHFYFEFSQDKWASPRLLYLF